MIKPRGDVQITLDADLGEYLPGEVLSGCYRLGPGAEGRTPRTLTVAVEWYTEGKGDEDRGAIYLETTEPDEFGQLDATAPRAFRVALPTAPLSYDEFLAHFGTLAGQSGFDLAYDLNGDGW